MSQITLKIDPKTAAMLEALKQHFNASTRAEVIRKAIVLLDLARDADEHERELVIIDDKDGTQRRILLR